MGDAFEALAGIRRWACKTLDASDAGKLCGMLSEVSRHANGLEDEVDQWKDRCRMLGALLGKSMREKEEITRRIRDNSEEAQTARAIADGLEWEVEDLKAQNAELRELVRDTWRIASSTQCTACVNYDTCTGTPCDLKNRMRQLGIEVES